jgi:hypothetical protein
MVVYLMEDSSLVSKDSGKAFDIFSGVAFVHFSIAAKLGSHQVMG